MRRKALSRTTSRVIPYSEAQPYCRPVGRGVCFRVYMWYLAHKNPPPPQNPTVAICLGSYGDPRGVGVSDERGTPVTP